MCAASEQLQNIPQEARLREGSGFIHAGPMQDSLAGVLPRARARLQFPELEPVKEAFAPAAGSKFKNQWSLLP